MSECCPECKQNETPLRAYRDGLLNNIAKIRRDVEMRPGSADCDVNVWVLYHHRDEAQAALDRASKEIKALFAGLGVRDSA